MHLAGDIIQAVGVFVAAIIIYFRPDWKIADPITTFVFAVLVMLTTWPTFCQCMRILMEFAPAGTDVSKVRKALNTVAKVVDLHVWCINEE